MGNEGQGSRDVAGEKQKHPWEILPEDEASANLSEKERENLKNKEEKRVKRKARVAKVKSWVGGHRKLLIIGLAAVVLVGGGIFAYFKIKDLSSAEEVYVDIDTPSGYADDYNIENAITSYIAYDYANTVVKKIALEGVSNPEEDTSKIEDNMIAYINTLTSDYEKVYYRLYTSVLLSSYGNTEQAKHYIDKIEQEGHELDRIQKYVYYLAYREYYYTIEDEENYELWTKKYIEDPIFDEEKNIDLSSVEELEG